MKCKPKRSAALFVATPFFPILVAAWAAGAAKRRDGSSWTSAGCSDRRAKTRGSCRKPKRAEATENIVDTAVGAGRFETLVEAVKAAGLVETLEGDGPFTVFAPVDEAFARLPEGALDELLADKERLTTVLSLHVVPERVPASALSSYAAIKTLGGDSLEVDTGLGVKVGSAYVIQADIEASNGIVHAIDTVLLPD